MDWLWMLLILFGGVVLLMATGMPVAAAFTGACLVAAFFIMGGERGLRTLVFGFYPAVADWTLLPLPMFILMGEILFQSGIATDMIDATGKLLGRLPGRLALVSVAAGTLLSVLTGSIIASTAMLGSTLAPEMHRRGYKKPMSIGPILGSGGLAPMIPPSTLAVLLAALGSMSIGRLLIAIVIPGLIMAVGYAVYIIARCALQPSVAPAYQVMPTPLLEKARLFVRYLLPTGIVVFLVTGVIFFGIASPSEAAATGVVGSLILVGVNGKLHWALIKKFTLSTLQVTGMVFFVIIGALAFSQVLAYSGASRGLAQWAISFATTPLMFVVLAQIVIFFLGLVLGGLTIMMVTLPVFIPIINFMHIDPVWFGVMMMINMVVAELTPPSGWSLFVMPKVTPSEMGVTFADCVRAAVPFLLIDVAVMMAILFFPALALWLPDLMMK